MGLRCLGSSGLAYWHSRQWGMWRGKCFVESCRVMLLKHRGEEGVKNYSGWCLRKQTACQEHACSLPLCETAISPLKPLVSARTLTVPYEELWLTHRDAPCACIPDLLAALLAEILSAHLLELRCSTCVCMGAWVDFGYLKACLSYNLKLSLV